jgi:hypothetical protein
MTLYIDTKPTLEWMEFGYHSHKAITPFAEYNIHPRVVGVSVYMDVERISIEDTVELAKAAAQADYEARTAERFRKVKVRDIMYYGLNLEDYEYGYNQALEDIHEAIDKANES